MHKNLDLFLTFARISATCFGGGYAMIPLLQRDLVEKKSWISAQELTDMFSIAQCTPGVISVNASTFVGSKLGGVGGALCATSGVLTPPICIISLLAAFLWPYLSNPWVQHALAGLQACVCALILLSVVRLFRSAVPNLPALLLFLVALLLSLFTSLSPMFLVLGAALCGLLLQGRNDVGENDGEAL